MEIYATVSDFGTLEWLLTAFLGLLLVAAGPFLLGVRYIPHNRVGIVEKLWSSLGPVEPGCLIALDGEAGYQADVLRGGVHFLYFPWQYRIHKVPLTDIPQGKIGYVFARDGEPLPPQQTLGRVVPSDNFQDARAFLTGDRSRNVPSGQRGRQRAILREGVYAINLALFVVITEDRAYQLSLSRDSVPFGQWHQQMVDVGGFNPVVVGTPAQLGQATTNEANDFEPVDAEAKPGDNIAIVTVHDGPSLEPGEIIAPAVATDGAAQHGGARRGHRRRRLVGCPHRLGLHCRGGQQLRRFSGVVATWRVAILSR